MVERTHTSHKTVILAKVTSNSDMVMDKITDLHCIPYRDTCRLTSMHFKINAN